MASIRPLSKSYESRGTGHSFEDFGETGGIRDPRRGEALGDNCGDLARGDLARGDLARGDLARGDLAASGDAGGETLNDSRRDSHS
jgi:hypothetical protein